MNHDYICPVEATLEIVGGKYKPLILWHLSGKTLRFGQLQKLLSSAATMMMAISVALAPRARMAVNASWPGVSRNVILQIGRAHVELQSR